MRARLPWILLAISMVLNVAIVGGLLYGWHGGGFGPRPERAVERVSDYLELNSAQEQELRQVIEGVVERRKARREAPPPPEREALVELLTAETFNEAETQRLLNEMSANRNLHWVEVSRDMHGFVSTLDAEQKEAFLRMAKERGFFRKLFRPQFRRGE